jgi:hypothetical protein
MQETFVDVTWRGLEVGKRVKLRAIHPADAYIDHTTPMPVGTSLVVKTDEGLEIEVTVARVHEQVGGSSETPGMQVVPQLEGAAAAWWQARAEEVPVPAAQEPPAGSADPRAAITAKPTLTMSAVEVERAMSAVRGSDAEPDAARTEVMGAVDPAALGLDGDDGGGVVQDDGLVDDGRRTAVMSAIDVSAIVAAAEADTSGPVSNGGNGAADADDGPSGDGPTGDGPTGDGPSSDGTARGKKRRGKRSKRGTRG